MSETLWARTSYRLLSGFAEWTLDDPDGFANKLARADIGRRPEMHLASAYAGIAVSILATIGALVIAALQGLALPWLALIFTVGLTGVGLGYGWAFQGPEIVAFMRGEKIDEQLPYAVNYMASMAQADVTPEELIENLSRQPVYGEVTVEAGRIRRDLSGFGMDLVTAIQRAADRAPSQKFRDFMQGLLTAVAAGGSLQGFLDTKAQLYMEDIEQNQEAFLDSLGILAESYVTVIVAGPLFVIIMLTVLILFGTSGSLPLELGYVMMLGLVPMANVGFAIAIDTMQPGL